MLNIKEIYLETKNPNRKADLAYITKNLKDKGKDDILNNNKKYGLTSYINTERSRLLRAFNNSDEKFNKEELEKKSLQELSDLIQKHNLKIQNTRKNDWQKHEQQVTAGINKLNKLNFFKSKTNKQIKFEARVVGGASQSDVQVKNLENEEYFFVECKLNFNSAEYFKYGISINKNSIIYNNKKFIEGIDNKTEIDFINRLFNKEINISSFLNKLVTNPNIKESWNKFLSNVTEVEKFVETNNELKHFSSKFTFNQKFPEDFKTFINIFDTYCDFYTEKYNLLIQKLFKLFDSSELDVSEYQIKSHNEHDSNGVFHTIFSLKGIIKKFNLKIFNETSFKQIANQIQRIEIKLNALLKLLGYSSENISAVKKLQPDEKTKYFFKLFISSVGRKSKNSNFNEVLTDKDMFGNMQICSDSLVETDELANMITSYYVKKDNCAYIQIDDTIYQFDEKINPFKIEGLPIFKDYMKKFYVSLKINDSLTKISLHIRALPPDKSLFTSDVKLLSFREKDKNYIMNHIKEIYV